MHEQTFRVHHRPFRIAIAYRAGDTEQFLAAVRFNSLVWGGLWNPLLPVEDGKVVDRLARLSVDAFAPDLWVCLDGDPDHLPRTFFPASRPFLSVPMTVEHLNPANPLFWNWALPLGALIWPPREPEATPPVACQVKEWVHERPELMASAVVAGLIGEADLASLEGLPFDLGLPPTDYESTHISELSSAMAKGQVEETLVDKTAREIGTWWEDAAPFGAYIVVSGASDTEGLAMFWNLRATSPRAPSMGMETTWLLTRELLADQGATRDFFTSVRRAVAMAPYAMDPADALIISPSDEDDSIRASLEGISDIVTCLDAGGVGTKTTASWSEDKSVAAEVLSRPLRCGLGLTIGGRRLKLLARKHTEVQMPIREPEFSFTLGRDTLKDLVPDGRPVAVDIIGAHRFQLFAGIHPSTILRSDPHRYDDTLPPLTLVGERFRWGYVTFRVMQPRSIDVRRADALTLLRSAWEAAGLTGDLSSPGRQARAIIRSFPEEFITVRQLASRQVYRVLQLLTPQRAERIADFICRQTPDLDREAIREAVREALAELEGIAMVVAPPARGLDELTAEATKKGDALRSLGGLIDLSLAHRGFVVECENCRHSARFHVAELDHTVRCPLCTKMTRFSRPDSPDEPRWRYWLSSPAYCLLDQGVLTHLLALSARQKEAAVFAGLGGVAFAGQGLPLSEIDVLYTADGILGLGECKTGTFPTPSEIRAYLKMGERLDAQELLFATLGEKPEYDETEAALKECTEMGFKVIVLTGQNLLDGVPGEIPTYPLGHAMVLETGQTDR